MTYAPEVLAAITYLESQDQSNQERAKRAKIALEIIHAHWDKPGRRDGVPFPSTDQSTKILNRFCWQSATREEKVEYRNKELFTVDDLSSLKMINLIQPLIDDTLTLESFLKKTATWSYPAVSVLVSSILWNLPNSKGEQI